MAYRETDLDVAVVVGIEFDIVFYLKNNYLKQISFWYIDETFQLFWFKNFYPPLSSDILLSNFIL